MSEISWVLDISLNHVCIFLLMMYLGVMHTRVVTLERKIEIISNMLKS
jgi:hypothetical protein